MVAIERKAWREWFVAFALKKDKIGEEETNRKNVKQFFFSSLRFAMTLSSSRIIWQTMTPSRTEGICLKVIMLIRLMH